MSERKVKAVTIIFPHQLFKKHPALNPGRKVVLVEEWLFFNQYEFIKQKLVMHRASMQFYKGWLEKKYSVDYIEATEKICDVRKLVAALAKDGVEEIHVAQLSDDWLERRLKTAAKKHRIALQVYASPGFLNEASDAKEYFDNRKGYFMADFYKWQRKKRGILVTTDGEPQGGKWSFDEENRKKLPKEQPLPALPFPKLTRYVKEAIEYVEKNYKNNYGEEKLVIGKTTCFYPTTFAEAEAWLKTFVEERLCLFGDYEDAMVANEHFLFHSVLTPMLNTGLLTPAQVMDAALKAAPALSIRLNSLEGFIRQVMGWREYIHLVYLREGRKQRTTNFWGFSRKIPASFWNGTTGIDPVDKVIQKVLQTGYSHHIERLMVMGNFMLLCEFDPDDVYKWFMEMYVDAYDWVMVPNTYGMTQFADGGLVMTKPYISSSNYIKKMSNYKNGDWQKIWDSLFWRFMWVHRDVLKGNHRLSMLMGTFEKMPSKKRNELLNTAENFLQQLDE